MQPQTANPFGHRRSSRLSAWDYSNPAVYLVTICTHLRSCRFGGVDGGLVRLSDIGKMVVDQWLLSEEARPALGLGYPVLMPKHVHGICAIKHQASERASKVTSLASFIGGFRAATSRIARERFDPADWLRQSNYWKHIVGGEQDLARIREDIAFNPVRWYADPEHSGAPESEIIHHPWAVDGLWRKGARSAPL